MDDNYEQILDLCIEELKTLHVHNLSESNTNNILDYFGIKVKNEDQDSLINYVKMNDTVTEWDGNEKRHFINQLIQNMSYKEQQLQECIQSNGNYVSFLEKEHSDYLTKCYKLNNSTEQDDLLHRMKLCSPSNDPESANEEEKEMIKNLDRIKELDDEIKELGQNAYVIKSELKPYRGLPPNVEDAKRKVIQLRNEYEKERNEFYKDIWHS